MSKLVSRVYRSRVWVQQAQSRNCRSVLLVPLQPVWGCPRRCCGGALPLQPAWGRPEWCCSGALLLQPAWGFPGWCCPGAQHAPPSWGSFGWCRSALALHPAWRDPLLGGAAAAPCLCSLPLR